MKLNEGILDFSVMGSDNAADFADTVSERLKPILIKESKEDGNDFNTDGPTNIAMSIVEGYLPSRYVDRTVQANLIRVLKAYYMKLNPDTHDQYDIVRRAIRMLSGKFTIKVI